MKFARGFLFGLIIGVGLTWFFTSTDAGRVYWGQIVDATTGWLRSAGDEAEEAVRNVDLDELAEQAADAARDIDIEDLADRAEETADQVSEAAGAIAVRARSAAFEAAERFPELARLGDTLDGWQRELLAYESEMQADATEQSDITAAERAMTEMFAPATRAAPIVRPASTPPEAPVEAPDVAAEPTEDANTAPTVETPADMFAAHPSFYACPVIQVSNPGRLGDGRELLDYTPWVDTPAGALIRAPVEAGCLSSGYGQRQSGEELRDHGGVDYYNRDGGTIYAAGDGVVVQAGEDGAYGNAVRIDHGGGVEGLYAHMVDGSLEVSEGDNVSLGEPIGVMGRTGRAYAVHLHYELRFADDTVDPLQEGKRESF